jgi:hypothetical protein
MKDSVTKPIPSLAPDLDRSQISNTGIFNKWPRQASGPREKRVDHWLTTPLVSSNTVIVRSNWPIHFENKLRFSRPSGAQDRRVGQYRDLLQ